ncbi:MAG: polysaccharide deacetylase family protein [Acidobacteriota bacterium]
MKPATAICFWDYDTQWGGDRSRSGGGPKSWGGLEFPNTDKLLALHASYEMPACFAVVGAAALPGVRPYHDPDQIRRIHAGGHEVASHSFRHDWLPALSRKDLTATLRESKAALEDCIGSPVTSFVPPYNQPFDYPQAGSFSIAERREAGRDRTDLKQLCESLAETGYTFCRVAYRPLHIRIAEMLSRRRIDLPSRAHAIAGVCCVRVNASGFEASTLRLIERCAERGGIAIIYGHPHSATAGGSQDISLYVKVLDLLARLRREKRMDVCVPRQITAELLTKRASGLDLGLSGDGRE